MSLRAKRSNLISKTRLLRRSAPRNDTKWFTIEDDERLMSKRGFFITFEGPEGSGKSSQARRLVRVLRRAKRPVVFVRDPGSTALGRRLRQVLLHDARAISSMAEALLFIAGRAQLVEEQIRPALRTGAVVVCDRFHDSTVAYQGFGGSLPPAWVNRMGREAIGGVMPDLTILLDLPVAAGFARLHRRRDRMERKTLAFHERLRRGYLTLAKREPRRFLVVDATQSKMQIQQQIFQLVMKRLSKKKV